MLEKLRIRFGLAFCLFAAFLFAGCDSGGAAKKEAAVAAGQKDSGSSEAKPESQSTESTPSESEQKETTEQPETKTETKAEPTDSAASPAENESAVSESGFDVSVAEGGALTFRAPATWKKAEVKARRFGPEFEISVPKSEGENEEAKDGRLTIMGAGGSVEANIERWYGQYTQPDGSSTKEASSVTNGTAAGCDVTYVDIKGTLLERSGGPFAGGETVERENYRMLSAIIQAGEHGQYFVKLYGPAKTIGDNEAAFKGFIESLKINDAAKGL